MILFGRRRYYYCNGKNKKRPLQTSVECLDTPSISYAHMQGNRIYLMEMGMEQATRSLGGALAYMLAHIHDGVVMYSSNMTGGDVKRDHYRPGYI